MEELGEKSSSHNLEQRASVIRAGSSPSSRKAFVVQSSAEDEEKEETAEKEEMRLEESEEGEGVDEYETTDFISMPAYSLESTFENDPLELEYSYGYNCMIQNLCVVDSDTLLWYTGNIIHIFNAKQRRLAFRRSALGQDISFIAKSKSTDEFAVAENGGDRVSPMIIIYRWPDFKVCSVLRGGATTYYKSVDFSPDGSKLVSQAGPPGDTLTIWDIRQKTAIMSFQNPDETVSKAVFSSFDPDVFVTCGAGHIKFWRLIETFTGLKIESMPGRFGAVENNDVSALCFLPEGRVVSNFCGGNLAIWRPDASLQLSFSMKNCEPCHSDLITFIQIYLEDNHVYTSSLDGKVRVWNYSYITSFYNDEQEGFSHVDIEPSYERKIEDKKGNFGTPLMMLAKDDQEFPYHFYGQDVKGGIWLLDLELKKNPDPWIQLYSCHAGPIYDMATSPGDYFLATVGCGGRMNVYSHSTRSMVMSKQFEDDGISLLWLPFEADPTGCTIVIGFRTGVLRVIVAIVKFTNEPTEQVSVVQVMKPHSSAITVLTINSAGNLLISGSEDQSIFLYSFYTGGEKVEVIPLGMVKVPGAVTDITWDQYKIFCDKFLVSCDNGRVAQINLDERNKEIIQKASMNKETYVLDISPTITEAIVRGKASTSRQYFSKYMGNNLIWIEEKSAAHSYHNYLYKVGGPPTAKLNISGGHTVQCTLELQQGKYMALGLNNGVVKIIKKSDEPHNFSDSWQIVMHNSRNCTIKKLSVSYDQKILYSCGTDSGIFAYKVNLVGEDMTEHKTLPLLTELPKSIKEYEVLNFSLEEERIKRKMEKEREKHKREVRKFKEKVITFVTSYYQLVEVNNALPKCLRIPKTFFRLQTQDERECEKRKILAHEKEILAPLRKRKKQLFKKVHTIKKHFIDPIKTQKFYVFAIRKPNYLKSFPERRLFSEDPLKEARDPVEIEQEKRWEKLMGGKKKHTNKDKPTEFERMMKKVVTKLGKEREMEIYYEHCRDGSRTEGPGLDSQSEEVPDLITAAGAFLSEYGKFTQAEKTTFKRINTNRLKRLKCAKENERVENLKTGFQNYYDRVDSLFTNLIKSETKLKEKPPPAMERLHHLLNIRQLIYLHKEKFNKALRELRREKTAIINYFYWAQEEYKYMVADLKQYRLDLDGIELPKPLEVVWDLEYPDHLKFKPGPLPKDTKLRMALYKKNLENIKKLMPIEELKKQVRTEGVQNHRLFQLLKYRKESFVSGIITIKETMENMITDFDRKFMPLLLQRSQASVDINFLKAEYSSTLEEVDILYRYEMLQTSASCYKFETIKMKHVYILRENIRKKKVTRFNDQMKECHKTIEDLNAKFLELVKDEKWAKHLGRTYKRKYKSPRKSGGSMASVMSSESSSDDDDDDDYDDDGGDDDNDDYEEPGAAVAYIYDETILPPGCDEDKFRYTFKLRNQRHVEENRIAEIKREKEIIVEEVKAIKRVIKICDALLALFYAGTFRFLKMMKDEMDDINYLIALHPSQIQIFNAKDPLNEVPPLEECKLIEQDDYLLKTQTLVQLKEAIDGVRGVVEKTQKSTRQQVKELQKLADQNSKRYQEIEALLASKFGESINVDKGQTYVLMSMVKHAIRRAANELVGKEKTEKKEAEKTDKLKHKGELMKTKKERTRTLQTLYTIEAENNRIMADKLAHEKRGTLGKIDLTTEREELLKQLAEIEDDEKKLATALKEV